MFTGSRWLLQQRSYIILGWCWFTYFGHRTHSAATTIQSHHAAAACWNSLRRRPAKTSRRSTSPSLSNDPQRSTPSLVRSQSRLRNDNLFTMDLLPYWTYTTSTQTNSMIVTSQMPWRTWSINDLTKRVSAARGPLSPLPDCSISGGCFFPFRLITKVNVV